jgi:hypothetical protein
MPKTSAIERNKKRVLLVDKHKAKRAELKAILANPNTTDVEFFAAQKKLAKLPARLFRRPHQEPLLHERPPARLHPAVRRVPYPIP